MPKRIAVSTLNASTIDILNTIRANASMEYQSSIPEITTATEIPQVGEILYGYPALANQFVNALVNRIALTLVRSATFNNPYKDLKKGLLTYGETVEEAFVGMAKARVFSAEKAEARELKRYLPDVKAAFHARNWMVMYPITIEKNELRMAFTSEEGVANLLEKIVDSVYRGAEYDEYLLFKYLIIKAVSHGKMYPVSIGDGTDLKDAAKKFRGVSNQLTFISNKYNERGVETNTGKEDQMIFMDSDFNAQFDVDVLASAYNMDKADFMGKLRLIDDFTTFDNDRFDLIRGESDALESVTSQELALMADVKACIVDKEWFQVYDNLDEMTEKQVASGLRWNYFYHVWKTISSSPFSNAIVFVTSSASISLPNTVTVTVGAKDVSAEGTVYTLNVTESTSLAHSSIKFIQTQDATTKGIAIHPFGAVIMRPNSQSTTLKLEIDGVGYTAGTAIALNTSQGATLTFSKDE